MYFSYKVDVVFPSHLTDEEQCQKELSSLFKTTELNKGLNFTLSSISVVPASALIEKCLLERIEQHQNDNHPSAPLSW